MARNAGNAVARQHLFLAIGVGGWIIAAVQQQRSLERGVGVRIAQLDVPSIPVIAQASFQTLAPRTAGIGVEREVGIVDGHLVDDVVAIFGVVAVQIPAPLALSRLALVAA